VTLPTFRPQIGDPTTSLDRFLCTMESAAMGLDFTTGGQVSLWGGQLVPYCGRKPADIVGHGTNLQNAALSWLHWGQDLQIKADAWQDAEAHRADGNAYLLQGDYDALPAGDRCSSTFEENHCIIVLPETSVDGTMALTGDPLCSGYRWRSRRGLRAYAEKLALTNRGDRTKLFYAVCPKYVLPDTGTEEPMPLVVTKLHARSGVATVKGPGKRAAVQVADREYFWFAPGATKHYVAEGILVPPLDNNPGDRSSVVLVGDEAAILLKMDVSLVDDTGDVKHDVGLTVDGVRKAGISV
jgi:hypothetical protein